MTTGDDDQSREHVDAVHTRFREKGIQKSHFCFACYEEFAAASMLEVFEHFAQKQHATYHSDCLYCQGKVYQYRDGDQKLQYFHNCWRWKRKIEKWSRILTCVAYNVSSIHPEMRMNRRRKNVAECTQRRLISSLFTFWFSVFPHEQNNVIYFFFVLKIIFAHCCWVLCIKCVFLLK